MGASSLLIVLTVLPISPLIGLEPPSSAWISTIIGGTMNTFGKWDANTYRANLACA